MMHLKPNKGVAADLPRFDVTISSKASEVQVQVRDGLHSSPSGWDDDAGALFTVQKPNLPPTLSSLMPDRPSPQIAGTLPPIKWTASASDPNGDAVLYKFWLNGPATGNQWAVVQDWSYNNYWTWANTPADAGAYSVYVYARDGYHAPASGYDSALGASYVLMSPLVEKRITTGSAIRDKPSLVFSGDGYLLALQSWEAGKNNQGDVLLQKFDPLWKMQKSIWVSNAKAYEDSPSLAFVGGYAFVAYVSSEKGNRDITICSPVSGAPFITTPRCGEFVVRNIVAGDPPAVLVAVHEVAFGTRRRG